MSLETFFKRFGKVTESYFFYNGEVELRYDVKAHKYFLIQDGELTLQDGVTNVVHIIDKSEVLMNWAVKVMAQKLFATTPTMELPDGTRIVPQMDYARYEKIVLEAKNAKDEHLETAGGIGHEAHDWIEKFIKATLAGNEGRRLELLAKFPDDERARNACLAALEWMAKHNVRWHATEQKIYSRQYKYAGTMDGLALVDSCDNPACCPKKFSDHLTIIDWKTSNYLYLEYLLQTAAYQQAFNEMEQYRLGMNELKFALSDNQATDRWVIRLGKDDAKFDPWHMTLKDFWQDFECFKLALNLGTTVQAIKDRIKAKEDAERAVAKAAKDEARSRKEAAEAKERADAKEKKAGERLEALAKACPASKKYKGMKKPTCNDGKPCEACVAIYAAAQKLRAAKVKQAEEAKGQKKPKAVKKDSLKSLTDLLPPLKMHPPTGPTHVVRVRDGVETLVERHTPCDGDHGGPMCGDPNCCNSPLTPEQEAEWQAIMDYYNIPQRVPQLLLTDGTK